MVGWPVVVSIAGLVSSLVGLEGCQVAVSIAGLVSSLVVYSGTGK